MKLSPIVDHGYLLNVTKDQHHAQDHKARHQKGGADDLESLLCLANFSEKAHSSLTGVTASQHHTKYTNAEAVAAVEAKDPFNHAGKVGIGVPNPAEKLDINGLIKIPQATDVDNDSPGIVAISNDDFLHEGKYLNHYGFGFVSVGSGLYSYISGYSGIRLFTNGFLRLLVEAGGNLHPYQNISLEAGKIISPGRAIKTATGSCSGTCNVAASVEITMQDYTFFPNVESGSASALDMMSRCPAEYDEDYVGRFKLYNRDHGINVGYYVRYRYIAS